MTISEATERLVRGYFDLRPLGALPVKGRAEPVAAWEVEAAHETRTRLEIAAERGLTPFVGRERERALLLEAFERARGGHGRVVFLVAEAGMGKSRLLAEMRRQLGAEAEWREGHCLSFGRAIPLHPLVDLVRRWLDIGEVDAEPARAEKIERGLAGIGPDLASAAPYLRALLSIDPADAEVRAMSPAERRGRIFEALRSMLIRSAERRPQVLVIEDLHWIDGASEQFLTGLMESVPAVRALVVLTYRPGYANPFGERSYFTRIVPAALSIEESARVAEAVLAADALPAELRALVAARAEGNPFYVEELARSLEESGAVQRAAGGLLLARSLSASVMPGTIHDVIAARIDRLAEAPKLTLQLASVVGREFSRRLVDRVSEIAERTDGALSELTALELIHERRLVPELVYAFKHALTQEVAYASLLGERRRELHRLVGSAIEQLHADRLPEQYEVLAHHFSCTDDLERALRYLVAAAEKATRAFGLRQALEFYAEALDVAARLGARGTDPPAATLMAIHAARADLLLGVGDFARSREAAETLVGLARGAQDRAAEAEALVRSASALQWAEDFPGALARAREAIELAEAGGAQKPLAGGLYVRGYVNAVSGRLDEAREDVERALAIGRAVGDPTRQALALHTLALRLAWRGEYRESLQLSTEGARLAGAHRLPIPLLRCLWNQGAAWTDLGEYDAALAALTQGLALAERIGDDAFIPRFQNTLGWLHMECGDLARGMELSERSYEVTSRSSRAGHGTGAERRAFIRNNEADTWMVRGDLASAANALAESSHIVRHPPPSGWMTWRYAMHCYASQGQLALLQHDPDRARRMADQSLELGVSAGSRKFEAWAWRIKGESAIARRAWDEADEALRRSLALATSIGQPRQTWLSHVARGRLDEARGRRDEDLARYRDAWTIITSLRAATRDAGLRAGLESSPLSCEVESLARR